MDFIEFRDLQQNHMNSLLKNAAALYVVDVDRDFVWATYLESFPPGTNPIFRERREFDCSACRQFVKQFGNVITIVDNQPVSIWRFQTGSDQYQPVVDALADLVESAPIHSVFLAKDALIGVGLNHERLGDQIITWNHLHVRLPDNLVYSGGRPLPTVAAEIKTNKEVLYRSFTEISDEAIQVVLDLIAQKSLYRGEEWKEALERFASLRRRYIETDPDLRDYFLWDQSRTAGIAVGRIKNHSIGKLLTDLTDGVELDQALRSYEKIVAPTNYKRPKPVFTKRDVDNAARKVEQLGLTGSLPRRFAHIDDITVNDTLFVDRNVREKLKGGSPFDQLKAKTASSKKEVKYDKVEVMPVELFLSDILPRAEGVEVLLENKHQANLVSLIAPQDGAAPSLFKWGNNFGWVYNGNIADSMKELVRSKGGNVEGVIRFSLRWNDQGDNLSDLDAHCIEPGGHKIFFGDKRHPQTSGVLDVDIINPQGVAVENITWSQAHKMYRGRYQFRVHCYRSRYARSGFSAEIEFGGEVHRYEYASPLRGNEFIEVATIDFDGTTVKYLEEMPSTTSSRDVWGMKTNEFVPVRIIMNSPNHWDQSDRSGQRHLFFMLKGAVNPDTPNGFFNEYLRPDLNEHRRVFEALGGVMAVSPDQDQLSGLGFSLTKRDQLVVKVKGATTRLIKIQF